MKGVDVTEEGPQGNFETIVTGDYIKFRYVKFRKGRSALK